ncbi:hypothetical protein [Aliiroseovarius sp.]|uniref:hypothetical protein n=1 Tax=Aliiroseovarius sp. TaxID=1872442 RepID=UPI003BA98064
MTQSGHITRLTLEDPDAWAALLDPGEDILWQGRPALPRLPGLNRSIWTVVGVLSLPLALIIAIFALVPDATTRGVLGAGSGVALGLAGWWVIRAIRMNRTMLYTVTTHRAIISRAPLGGTGWVNSDSWDITSDMPLHLIEGPDVAAIHFASREVWDGGHMRSEPVGFLRLADPTTVLAALRQAQSLDRVRRDAVECQHI